MTESRFVYVTYIRTTPEKRWMALVDPEFTRQYRSDTVQSSKLKPGATWRNMIPDGRVGDGGEVIELDLPRRLVITWRNEFVPAMRDEKYSQLSHELEPMDDMMKLTTTHTMPGQIRN